MSLGNPEVLTGARGPQDEVIEKPKARPGRYQQIPEGKVIFQAIAGRYRLQLTAPEDLRLTDGRIQRGERPLVAQFAEYMLVCDEKKDAKMIELIRAHPDFGREFWDLKDKLVLAKEKQTKSAVDFVLGADEDQKAAILEALLQGKSADFDLPKKE